MKFDNSCTPDTATGIKLATEITDKRGDARRWQLSPRHIDNLIAQGLPHCKIGARRVRIIVEDADAWMVKQFAIQRRAAARVAADGGKRGAE